MRQRKLFFLVYGLSGFAALVYEVVWTRLLTLQMGHTVAAVSTVLAAYMGGMAIGAAAGGRIAERRSAAGALRLYAQLEIAIGACAVALPFALAAARPVLSIAYADGDGGPLFALTRVTLSLLALAVPCAAMGATFPVAARCVVDRADRTGASAGGLYAANTVGAACGAAVSAFVLIPALGLRATTWIAVLGNIVAAVAALRIASRQDVAAPPTAVEAVAPMGAARGGRVPNARKARSAQPPDRARSRAMPARETAPVHPAQPGLAAVALAVTGFVALVDEVAWTRVLALVIGPTTYAFGAMLAVFIAGIALGSAAAARVADRVRHPIVWLAGVMLAIGGAAVAVMPQVSGLPLRVAAAVAAPNADFGAVMREESILTAALLLPLAVALGAAFPVALRVATDDRETAPRRIALVYAANTVGAIAGSLAGGFVLVPALGLQRTIVAAASLAAAGGAGVAIASRARRLAAVTIAIGAVAIAAIGWRAKTWDLELLSSGAYKYAPYIEGADFESALRAGALLYYKDGAAATVSVRRVAGTVSLAIDGKVDASNAGDMLTQKLLGHLPVLMHPRPSRVAIIGLGSGVTLGAALSHPIARADMLEISPEVVEASRFFDAENGRALADPRARLIVGDGRSHLLLGRQRYDVIVSEPSNPWMAGIASLFTREFFGAAARALEPDGILCQWAHTYDMSDSDLRSIAATFASVFPEGTMWLIGEGDLLLIGSRSPILPRLEGLAAAFARPGVAADLAEVSVASPESLLTMFVAGPSELRAYAQGAVLQTDDRTALEFSAPRSIFGRTRQDNAATLRALARAEALPPVVRRALTTSSAAEWRSRGRMLLQAEAYGAAYDAFARAIAADPRDEPSVEGFTKAAGSAGRQDAAMQMLAEIAAREPRNVAVHVELSRLLAARGDIERAVESVRPLMIDLPDDPRPAEQVASILADAGDRERLAPLVEHLGARWPDLPAASYYRASLAFLDGRPDEALRLASDALRRNPREERLQNLAGAAAASLGRRDEARAAFTRAVELDPSDPTAHLNLGLLELEAANPRAAVNHFAEALILDPRSDRAREGLADALTRLGRSDRAARLRPVTR
jgi:spermidine synthase